MSLQKEKSADTNNTGDEPTLQQNKLSADLSQQTQQMKQMKQMKQMEQMKQMKQMIHLIHERKNMK